MVNKKLSVTGAAVGGLAGWVADVAITEVTGHHVTTGILELLGAAAGLCRLDKRLAAALQDTLNQAQGEDREDYRQVKERIQELTRDLPELREILSNMVDAGIQAQKA
jgi:Mg2+ and Co2+ transporter CorA